MKNLEKTFIGKGEVKGHLFNQIRRGKNAFIYEVTCESRKYYEVFKRKISKKRFSDDLIESYPKSNSFGYWALTCDNLDRANEIFNKYENSEPFKIPN